MFHFEFLDQNLASARKKIDLARIDIIEIFSSHAHSFGAQIVEHEFRIALAYVDCCKSAQDIAATKYLGLMFSRLAPAFNSSLISTSIAYVP